VGNSLLSKVKIIPIYSDFMLSHLVMYMNVQKLMYV
jgi:hypothetical protein